MDRGQIRRMSTVLLICTSKVWIVGVTHFNATVKEVLHAREERWGIGGNILDSDGTPGDGARHLRKRNTDLLPATSVQLNCVVVWLLAACPSTLVPKSPNSSFLFPLLTLNTQLSTPGVGRVFRLVTPDCDLLSSPLIPVAASHKVRHTLQLSKKAFYLSF